MRRILSRILFRRTSSEVAQWSMFFGTVTNARSTRSVALTRIRDLIVTGDIDVDPELSNSKTNTPCVSTVIINIVSTGNSVFRTADVFDSWSSEKRLPAFPDGFGQSEVTRWRSWRIESRGYCRNYLRRFSSEFYVAMGRENFVPEYK